MGKKNNGSGNHFAKPGTAGEADVMRLLSQRYRVPTVVLDDYEIDADLIRLVSRALCEKHKVIPISRAGGSLIVAMVDPGDVDAIDELKSFTGFMIEPVIAAESAIVVAIQKYYGGAR